MSFGISTSNIRSIKNKQKIPPTHYLACPWGRPLGLPKCFKASWNPIVGF